MLSTNNNHRLTVLLADTADGWAGTIKTLLAPQGVQTVGVRTGREALRLIESGLVHVAVLDAQLPQLNGMAVVRRMREMPSAPPAILLAEHLTNHLLQEALFFRVFSVLKKPIQMDLLLDSLARVMKRHYESRWPGEA